MVSLNDGSWCHDQLNSPAEGTFEIDWEEQGVVRTHAFTALFDSQCEQWCSRLQALMPIQPITPNIRMGLLPAQNFDDTEPCESQQLGAIRSPVEPVAH